MVLASEVLRGPDSSSRKQSTGKRRTRGFSRSGKHLTWIVKAVLPTPPSPRTTSLYKVIFPAIFAESCVVSAEREVVVLLEEGKMRIEKREQQSRFCRELDR